MCLSSDGAAIELEQGELFEDDGPAAGFSYKPNEEKLSEKVWIKKELLIPNPGTKKATLLVGPGGAIRCLVNGKLLDLGKAGKAGNYWAAYVLPADVLVPGKNEIVLHGSGKIWIARDDEFAAGSRTRTTHPNRSARSTDGGKTWDYDHLGTNSDVDGEYYVRVFLEHFRPQGSLTLPVLDAGNLAGRQIAAPIASPCPVRVTLQGESGDALRLAVRVRSGPVPAPDPKSWSDWQNLGADGLLQNPKGRYIQATVDFVATDPLRTPKLKHVVVEADPKQSVEWTGKLKVIDSHNEDIVRTSIPFEYEPFDHPGLKSLRQKYKLDEVVKGAKEELDLIGKLAVWSARQWDKGHLKECYPGWDAQEILKPHADGKPVGGFCQQYNLVFLQACESFGLPGRAISLGQGIHGGKFRGGHEVVEIWSNVYKKWIYVDGDAAWYFVDEGQKTPLSLWELRQRQLQKLVSERIKPVQVVKLAETRFEWKGLDSWPPFVELRLVPRSNFLQEKSPLPLNQGMRGWFWTGHHAWTDSLAPASLLYGNRVGNRRNWDWTLNQAHYDLEATETPGELRIHLDTETPGFETFMASIDGQGKQAVDANFLWKLHKGKNRLEVLPRNKSSREGISSWVVVEYE